MIPPPPHSSSDHSAAQYTRAPQVYRHSLCVTAFVLCVLDVDWLLSEACVLCYRHEIEPGHNNHMHAGSITAMRASMAGVHTVGSATFSLTALFPPGLY